MKAYIMLKWGVMFIFIICIKSIYCRERIFYLDF